MKRTLSFEETSNSKHNSQLINSKNNNKTDDNRCSTVEKNQKLPEQVTNVSGFFFWLLKLTRKFFSL